MVSINDLLPPAKVQTTPQFARMARSPPQTLATRRKQLDLSRPSTAEREEQLQRTQEALQALIAAKCGETAETSQSEIIDYQTTSGANKKLRIVEQQNDPLEPPRHKYRKEHKVTPVTTQTAAPILRQEPKLSVEEKQEWLVPASVSNWKNPRGYIIDLDKRAAADKSLAPVASTKHNDMAAALAAADSEFRAEQDAQRQEEEQAALELETQQRLKLKLLSQKWKTASTEKRKRLLEDDAQHAYQGHDAALHEDNGVNDLFDSRLFHKSKRKHDVYDKPLFGGQGHRPFRPSGPSDPSASLDHLSPVEFEEQ